MGKSLIKSSITNFKNIMRIKNFKIFGISKGQFKESINGVDPFLPIMKQFLNYLQVSWVDKCCGDSGTAAPKQVLDFADNSAALDGGLEDGEMYRLPYSESLKGYPMALVGPRVIPNKTFTVSKDPCGLSDKSELNLTLKNIETEQTFLFKLTRAVVDGITPFTANPTVPEGNYSFTITTV